MSKNLRIFQLNSIGPINHISIMATKLADATDKAAEMTDERLIKDFGCEPLDNAILERWEKVTGKKPHMFMRRGLYFAHRELKQILDAKEQGKPIFIYTGRGPSSDALHLGHLCPFIINKYIQDALDCYFIIQVTDDEKFMRDKELTWEQIQAYTDSNIKDILAMGFNPEKTFIMRESKHHNINAPFLAQLSRLMTLHVIQSIFGFTEQHSVGYVVFPAKQIAPAFGAYFSSIFTHNSKDLYCLIPCGREQDPYFRYARELANRMKIKRPCTIYGRFIPALQGNKKMTASSQDSAIYLTDTPEQIRHKIIDCAHTAWTPAGANLDEDVVYQYLAAFLDDDQQLDDIKRRYGPGELKEGENRMTVEEIKEILIKVLSDLVLGHQERKSKVTNEMMEQFEKRPVWN